MTIVLDNSQWFDTILNIKNDYGRYKNLADKAIYYVKKYYNVKTYAKEWKEQIIKLVNK